MGTCERFDHSNDIVSNQADNTASPSSPPFSRHPTSYVFYIKSPLASALYVSPPVFYIRDIINSLVIRGSQCGPARLLPGFLTLAERFLSRKFVLVSGREEESFQGTSPEMCSPKIIRDDFVRRLNLLWMCGMMSVDGVWSHGGGVWLWFHRVTGNHLDVIYLFPPPPPRCEISRPYLPSPPREQRTVICPGSFPSERPQHRCCPDPAR